MFHPPGRLRDRHATPGWGSGFYVCSALHLFFSFVSPDPHGRPPRPVRRRVNCWYYARDRGFFGLAPCGVIIIFAPRGDSGFRLPSEMLDHFPVQLHHLLVLLDELLVLLYQQAYFFGKQVV
ncbi:hypothetical protein U1Q18_052751 [Sarracenia purpurea var. burkii]